MAAAYYRLCLSIALAIALISQCSAASRYLITNYPFMDEDISSTTVLPAASSTQGAVQGGGGGQKVWCVGKPAADDVSLNRNIEFACGEGGVDCRGIQAGGACFRPNTPIAHASYAMNMYYQKNARNWWTCFFNNTALLVLTDPSFGNCKYTAQ